MNDLLQATIWVLAILGAPLLSCERSLPQENRSMGAVTLRPGSGTVLDVCAGGCLAPDTCGGGGVANQCGFSASLCSKFASPAGNDTGDGSITSPYKTAQKLADSLSPGQVGCLRGNAGDFTPDGSHGPYVLDFTKGGTSSNALITLTSYPGERATLRGAVSAPRGKSYIKLSNLNLNSTGYAHHTIEIASSDVTVQNCDVTNGNTEQCFMLGGLDRSSGRPQALRAVIRRNKIHGCGAYGDGNKGHGIYGAHAADGLISENMFWEIAGYAIQFYPNCQNMTFEHNVVDGSAAKSRSLDGSCGPLRCRGGLVFAGDIPYPAPGDNITYRSNNNRIRYNVLTNAYTQNIDYFWPQGPPAPVGNVAHDNCVWGAHPCGESCGGTGICAGTCSSGVCSGGGGGCGPNISPPSGFTDVANTTIDPAFVDLAGHDYRVQSTTCLSVVRYDTASVFGF